MVEQIIIDGRMGEGGGQVRRTALALATLLCRPMTVTSIRQGRQRPGLRPQHLTAVRALAKISSAQVTGAHENASSLTFRPGSSKGGSYHFTIGTAGSVTLLDRIIPVPLARIAFGDDQACPSAGAGCGRQNAQCAPYIGSIKSLRIIS